jgi:hypothetical protein
MNMNISILQEGITMEWIKETFGTRKPILAMCHFNALPGDPGYDAYIRILKRPYNIYHIKTDMHSCMELQST